MREYFKQLIVTAVLCGLGGHLLPGGEGGTYGRHWRLLSGVCMLLLLVQPIRLVVREGENLWHMLQSAIAQAEEDAATYDTQHEELLQQWDVRIAACAIEQALCEQFAMDAEDVEVTIRLQAETDEIAHVYVALSGRAIWQDAQKIRQYIENTVGRQATVYLGG